MNAFDSFGAQHARREKPQRAPRIPETEQEKRQAEHDARMKRYRRLVNEERAAAYALPGGIEAQAVVRWAGKMMPGDGDELLTRVGRLPAMDKQLRARLLADLDELICRLRVRNGLAEIDDPLPSEPDSVFMVLRRMLG